MNKILIVDSNKMLAKLLAKKINSSLGFEVDFAGSIDEAKALLTHKYFLCFFDASGQNDLIGLDYVLERKNPTIVLSTNSDAKFHEECMKKDVLSFIFKEDEDFLTRVEEEIKKLKYQAKIKVILAMSRLNERNEVKNFLNLRNFEVMGAAHGEEVMSYLQDHEDTKIIIADANMPVLGGVEFVKRVREDFEDINILMLGDKDDFLEAELLRARVDDYLIKPFNKELFYARLDRVLTHMNDKQLLNQIKDIDPISRLGGYNKLSEELNEYFNFTQDEDFALAFVNIDNLSTFNEEYGYDIGDEVIRICANEMKNELKGRDIIGRYDREHFCIVLKNIDEANALKLLSQIRVNIKKAGILINLDEIFFTASIGVAFGKTPAKFDALKEGALKALIHAKTSGKDRIEVCS